MNLKAKSRKFIELWQKLSEGSVNRKIFAATVTVGLLTGLVKFAAVGKELVVAWRFGVGDEVDAFVLAMVIPQFAIFVIANSLKLSLVPVYIKVRKEQGQDAAQKLFSGVIVLGIILLILLSSLIALTAHWYLPLLASGFTLEKQNLTINLLQAISPIIILSGLINIWGGVLNAGERFALAALSPVIMPLVTISLLLSFPDWGIYTLAGGLILGSLLELLLLGVALRKQKISLLPKWNGFDRNIRQVSNQYISVTIGALLTYSAILIDQSMAAMLSSGSVSALSYANRVIALPLNLAILALGTAVVPYISQTIAEQNWGRVKHTFNYYLRSIFIVTVPLTIFLIIASKLIIKLLFERGSFTSEDTEIVSQIQIFYALKIPFQIAAVFVVRLINSLGVNHFLVWGSVINLVVNIVANYFFLQWIGVEGIALSTSLVYLISFIFLYTLTKKHLNKISIVET